MPRTHPSQLLRRGGVLDVHPDRPPAEPARTLSLRQKEDQIEAVLARARSILLDSDPNPFPDVRDALHLIHTRLFEHSLSAGDVNAVLSSPASRLRFLKETGKHARAYIEDARLLVAMGVLEQSWAEVYLVADAVGYDHYETFSRAFARVVGVSPSAYRRSVRGTTPSRRHHETS